MADGVPDTNREPWAGWARDENQEPRPGWAVIVTPTGDRHTIELAAIAQVRVRSRHRAGSTGYQVSLICRRPDGQQEEIVALWALAPPFMRAIPALGRRLYAGELLAVLAEHPDPGLVAPAVTALREIVETPLPGLRGRLVEGRLKRRRQ